MPMYGFIGKAFLAVSPTKQSWVLVKQYLRQAVVSKFLSIYAFCKTSSFELKSMRASSTSIWTKSPFRI